MKDADAMVFVVDDDSSIREAIKNLVSLVGLGVETFGTAQEFLRSERPDMPGCVVLDVELPGLSGLDLQRQLAAHRIHCTNCNVPTIITVYVFMNSCLKTRTLTWPSLSHLEPA